MEEVLAIAVDCEGVVVPEVDVNKVGMCEITGGDLFSCDVGGDGFLEKDGT